MRILVNVLLAISFSNWAFAQTKTAPAAPVVAAPVAQPSPAANLTAPTDPNLLPTPTPTLKGFQDACSSKNRNPVLDVETRIREAWGKAVSSLQSEDEAKQLWQLVQTCSPKTPENIPWVAADLMTAANAKNWRSFKNNLLNEATVFFERSSLKNDSLKAFMQEAASGADSYALPQLTRLAFIAEKWLLSANSIMIHPKTQIEVATELIYTFTSIGRLARIPPIVDLAITRKLPIPSQLKDDVFIANACWAYRDLGQVSKCSELIQKMSGGKRRNEMESAQTYLATGQFSKALDTLQDIVAKYGQESGGDWLYFNLSFAQFYNNKFEQAAASMNIFIQRQGSNISMNALILEKVLRLAIMREKKQFASAWKEVDEINKLIDGKVDKTAYVSLTWDWSVMMLAMSAKDIQRLNAVLARIKPKFKDDGGQDFGRLVVQIVEKKILKQSVDKEIERLKLMRGAGHYTFVEFQNSFNRMQ